MQSKAGISTSYPLILTQKGSVGTLETELAKISCREGLRLTGIGHESDTVTHHTHLVQTGLPIEEDETTNASGEKFNYRTQEYSLSIPQVTLDDPPILKERVSPLVVS